MPDESGDADSTAIKRFRRTLGALTCAVAVVSASCASTSQAGGESPPANTASVLTTTTPTTNSTTTDLTTVHPPAVASHVLVAPCGDKPVVMPLWIVLACGDGNAQVVHLVWTSWGSSDARASGDYAVNDCSPTCVGGKFQEYPATVILADVKAVQGSEYFTTLSVQFTAASPFNTSTREFPLDTP